MPAPLLVLEGSWWNNHERPRILPFLDALVLNWDSLHSTSSQRRAQRLDLGHRTIRGQEDLTHWMATLPPGAGAFVYIACHGSDGSLIPSDGRSPVSRESVLAALAEATERGAKGSIDFLHIGACEFLRGAPTSTLRQLRAASGARWVSGFSREVGWLDSTLIEMNLIGDIFLDYWRYDRPQITGFAQRFKDGPYAPLASAISFAMLATDSQGEEISFVTRERG